MWVISQDKTRLVESKSFEIEKMGKINKDGIWESSNGCRIRDDKGFVIAVYSSKEKALKVLDMLQMCITGEIAFKREYLKKFRDIGMGTYSAREFVKEMQRQAFQMPQDEEVE